MLTAERVETSNEPTERSDWGTFGIVVVVLALTQLGFFLISAPLSLYLHDLHAPDDRIGLEVGLANVTGLVGTVAVGPAINRFGARVFLSSGAAIYLLTSLAMLAFRQETAVAVFRALQGIGLAVLMPGAYTLGAELVSRRRVTALATLGSLSNVALAAGPPAGILLYERGGATWLFLAAGFASILGLLASLLIPGRKRPPEAAPGLGFDRVWVPVILANGLAVMYWGGILAYLPLYLRSVHGPNAGIFFTADAVGVLLLRIPTGMLADRRGSLIPKLLGLALTVPGIGLLVLAPSLLMLIVSGALTGIGAGLFITGILGDLSHLSTERNRGTAMAMSGASFSAGLFIGSSLSGLLIGPGGFNAILLFGVLSCIAAVPFALRQGYRPERTG